MAANIKMTAFSNTAIIVLMMEAESTSETSTTFCGTTRRSIPDGCHRISYATASGHTSVKTFLFMGTEGLMQLL
jgi:hypothetical protein